MPCADVQHNTGDKSMFNWLKRVESDWPRMPLPIQFYFDGDAFLKDAYEVALDAWVEAIKAIAVARGNNDGSHKRSSQ